MASYRNLHEQASVLLGQASTDRMNRPPTLRVRTITPGEVTPAIIQAWADLETRALQPNPYLSPYFVLPAIHHFSRKPEPLILLVESQEQAKLLGVGVFNLKTLSLHFPFPHLAAYRSHHSYEDGFLVDSHNPVATLDALFGFLSKDAPPWHAVHFSLRPNNTNLAELMNSRAHAHGFNRHELKRVQRAILKPAEAGEHYLRTRLKHRYKDCSRLLRRLSKQGKVTWHYVAGSDISTDTVKCFLELEHMGWKGDVGTSLASRPHETSFFREMIAGFQIRQRVFFAELRLDGKAISSSCNLLSGNAGFAFKIGWHTDHARSSPGILNEFKLILYAPECCQHLQFIDSGASPGGYIDQLWLDRRTLVSSIYTATVIGNTAAKMLNLFQRTINK